MDTPNLTTPMQVTEENRGRGYSAPELFEIGTAERLIQGVIYNQPYRDCSNEWTTGWPQSC